MLSFLHRWGYCWKFEFDADVKIENHYHYDGEQLSFLNKIYIKTRSKMKDLSCDLYIGRNENANLFDKNCTQENVKCHIQHEESRLRWIVIEQVNVKYH